MMVDGDNSYRFYRCFLEGGGSTDSFFVREDLQVENRN